MNITKRKKMGEFESINETLVVNLFPLPFKSDILLKTVDYFFTLYSSKAVYEGRTERF